MGFGGLGNSDSKSVTRNPTIGQATTTGGSVGIQIQGRSDTALPGGVIIKGKGAASSNYKIGRGATVTFVQPPAPPSDPGEGATAQALSEVAAALDRVTTGQANLSPSGVVSGVSGLPIVAGDEVGGGGPDWRILVALAAGLVALLLVVLRR